jgi:hypothetical protein
MRRFPGAPLPRIVLTASAAAIASVSLPAAVLEDHLSWALGGGAVGYLFGWMLFGSGQMSSSSAGAHEDERTRRQRPEMQSAWIGLAAAVAILVVPPWQFRCSWASGQSQMELVRPGPYHSIFAGAPKVPEQLSSGGRHTFEQVDVKYWRAEVDWPRLLLPLAAVAILTSGTVVTLSRRSQSDTLAQQV